MGLAPEPGEFGMGDVLAGALDDLRFFGGIDCTQARCRALVAQPLGLLGRLLELRQDDGPRLLAAGRESAPPGRPPPAHGLSSLAIAKVTISSADTLVKATVCTPLIGKTVVSRHVPM